MASIYRATKKIIYAGLFLGLVVGFISFFVIPSLNLFDRRQELVPTRPTDPVVVEKVDTIPHDGSLDVVTRIRNPNPRAGVPSYPVTFIVVDEAGNEIKRVSRETYLLPGTVHFVAALDLSIDRKAARVRIETPSDFQFVRVPESFALPSFSSFLRERSIKSQGEHSVESQRAAIRNTGTLGYRHVDITAVALDRNNVVVGVSTTFIGNLLAGDQREFVVEWPTPTSVTEQVLIIPSTNIYDAENTLTQEGDPSLLR